MISICVPTSSMKHREHLFVRLLDSLWIQTYQDFEVVVTDNSDDDVIETICRFYKTGIRYYRNPVKGMAQNTNEAIRRSKGELIKILYMDDFLSSSKSLMKIVNNFMDDDHWLVTGCTHMNYKDNFTQSIHYPLYSDDIYTGNNTIGSPSVLTIRNYEPLLFDENLTWLLDCDYYKRMHDRYGEPVLLRDVNVILGLHDGQATNTMGDERKLQETNYMKQKWQNVV